MKTNHETTVKYDNANGEKVKTNVSSGKFEGEVCDIAEAFETLVDLANEAEG